MKILITGGAGFIGSNLAGELSQENEVTVLDDLSTANPSSRAFAEGLDLRFIKGSINDLNLLKELLIQF